MIVFERIKGALSFLHTFFSALAASKQLYTYL